MQSTSIEPDPQGLTLVIVTCAWLVGILLDAQFYSQLHLSSSDLLIGAAVALVLVLLLWRHARLSTLIILCLLLGAWRYSSVSPINDPQAISAFISADKLAVRGTVVTEPTLQGRSRVLLIEVNSVSNNAGKSWQDAHGRMEARTLDTLIEDPYAANYGDSVELHGRLQMPQSYSPPGVFADMAFPRISVKSTGGNPILAALYSLRVVLANIIAQSLPQPVAALLIAIALGLRTPALKPLIPLFNETGTAHLIVPSGFKVTLLAGQVDRSTQWLYKKPHAQATPLLPAQRSKQDWRHWLATALTIASIVAYTILSGAGAPAIRAGIMGTLIVIAPRLGRIYYIYTALALAALLITLFDPFVLWDVGFQLSLLGTLGIVRLTHLFQRLLHPIERLPFGHYIAELIAVTLAAQTATLPILAANFNHQISFIAPIANVLTVPLLEVLILLGLLICGTGLLFAPLAVLCGWVAWPLLWYVTNIITWCAGLHADWPANNWNSGFTWAYYALFTLLTSVLLHKWPAQKQTRQLHVPPPLLSRRTWRMLQFATALLVILATGAMALAAQPNGQLKITFLSVSPTAQAAQGEAIFISTPDNKTILIDGGLDTASLAQELDSRLPSWQRSLDMVVLTTARQDHLIGLQDIITRYQIGEVVDAGMLHPSRGYALWRRTISQRNLPYVQVHQGTTLAVGTQVVLQVLAPSSPLHKSSNEAQDDALVVRLVAPGLHLLLLGSTALSKFALTGLMTNIDQSYLQANVVQIVAEPGKVFPPELSTLLQAAHPSLLVITPAQLSPKQRKAGETTTIIPLSALGPIPANWQVTQTSETGTIEINSGENGWSMNPG